MHEDALAATKDAGSGTGPRTPAGKANSCRNAITTGLYTAHDFIRRGEEEEYSQTQQRLMAELAPVGVLEETFATEIMGATWRLRRCRLIEAAFNPGASDLDPMIDERTEKQQKSVDRARAQSHLIIRRCVADMRTLQNERTCCGQREDSKVPGLADLDALTAVEDRQLARESGLGSFCKPSPAAPAARAQIGRNTPCPCGSRNKYKRCCGKNAPPLLNLAA
jgi:hypothetical protein